MFKIKVFAEGGNGGVSNPGERRITPNDSINGALTVDAAARRLQNMGYTQRESYTAVLENPGYRSPNSREGRALWNAVNRQRRG